MKQALILVVVGFSALLFAPERAHARGVIVYHWGDDVFETGPLPEPWAQEEGMENAKAGYICHTAGLFWAHLWTSDCRPVAYEEHANDVSFMDENDAPELIAAIKEKYDEGDRKMGFWPGYGRWFMLLALLGFAGYGIFSADEEEDEQQPNEAPPADIGSDDVPPIE